MTSPISTTGVDVNFKDPRSSRCPPRRPPAPPWPTWAANQRSPAGTCGTPTGGGRTGASRPSRRPPGAAGRLGQAAAAADPGDPRRGLRLAPAHHPARQRAAAGAAAPAGPRAPGPAPPARRCPSRWTTSSGRRGTCADAIRSNPEMLERLASSIEDAVGPMTALDGEYQQVLTNDTQCRQVALRGAPIMVGSSPTSCSPSATRCRTAPATRPGRRWPPRCRWRCRPVSRVRRSS